jgi:hypothetical protein
VLEPKGYRAIIDPGKVVLSSPRPDIAIDPPAVFMGEAERFFSRTCPV